MGVQEVGWATTRSQAPARLLVPRSHGASAPLTDGCQDEKLLGNEIEIPVANAAWCAAPLRNKGMTDSLAAVLQLNRETRNSKRECPKMRHQQVTIGSRRNDISRKKADGKRLVRLERDEDDWPLAG